MIVVLLWQGYGNIRRIGIERGWYGAEANRSFQLWTILIYQTKINYKRISHPIFTHPYTHHTRLFSQIVACLPHDSLYKYSIMASVGERLLCLLSPKHHNKFFIYIIKLYIHMQPYLWFYSMKYVGVFLWKFCGRWMEKYVIWPLICVH